MNGMKRIARFLVLLLLPALAVSAGEDPVSLRLQGLSLTDAPVENLFWKRGDSYEPFPVPATFLPASIDYTGPNPMALYTRKGEGAAATFRPVASVNLPEKSPELILLCRWNGQEVNVAPVSISEDRFPDGAYMIFNLGERPIFFVMGENRLTLKPKSAQVQAGPGDRRAPIPVVLRFADDPENLSLVSTTWFHNPLERTLVFFHEEDRNLHVRTVTRPPSP